MEKRIENAKIIDVSLTMADHGCLTFYLTLEGDCWGVGVGGYVIGHGYLGADKFEAESDAGLEAMMRIMDTVGVEKWEDLKGKYIRIESTGFGGSVNKIGNLIKDKWFDLKEFFQSKQNEKVSLGSTE